MEVAVDTFVAPGAGKAEGDPGWAGLQARAGVGRVSPATQTPMTASLVSDPNK